MKVVTHVIGFFRKALSFFSFQMPDWQKDKASMLFLIWIKLALTTGKKNYIIQVISFNCSVIMTHYRATYCIFQNKKPWKGTQFASVVPYPFTTKKLKKQPLEVQKWSFVKLSSTANLNIYELILAGDEVDEGLVRSYKCMWTNPKTRAFQVSILLATPLCLIFPKEIRPKLGTVY